MSARRESRGRLSRSAEFERVYRQGRSTANRHLVLYSFPNDAPGRPRLGLSVSRKVGGAVERNRLKRLLREAFARAEGRMPGGHDVVLVARPPARELVEREGLSGVDAALTELLARSGLAEAADEADAATGDDRPAAAGDHSPDEADAAPSRDRDSGAGEEADG